MEIWAFLGGLVVLLAFGAVMYRAGAKSANNKHYKATIKAYDKVGKVVKNNSGLGRAILLQRLRELAKNKK